MASLLQVFTSAPIIPGQIPILVGTPCHRSWCVRNKIAFLKGDP
jgi:hypothetical protein